ncbi:ribosomal L18 C-terminal region-domain-containing protein [Phellopilus nigrolimitatus]|nr:ribosomal L18 C-terminal region-domain-containing protein [Phellopilus nigrolimitatus]
MNFFRKTMKPVEQVLKDAGVKKDEVDEVVLVGGSAYATGFLCARRALTKLGLADKRSTRRMHPALSNATSTGSLVFGAMKGVSDGGIFIPYSEKCFPGYDPEAKTLDAEVLKKYIFGGHVAEYMESLEEEDDERFKKQFAMYLANGVGSEDMEEIHTNAYAAIREDPMFKLTEKSKDWEVESLKHKTHRLTHLTHEQRIENIQTKIKTFQAGRSAEAEINEDEEE